jgi:hypothetical protein
MELVRPWFVHQAVFDGRLYFVADLQAERLHAEGWVLPRLRGFMEEHRRLAGEGSHASCFYAGQTDLPADWQTRETWEYDGLSERISLEEAETLYQDWQAAG